MTNPKKKTSILAECAILTALAVVLSMIKIYEAPLGGSVTLFSMVPILLAACRHGAAWGFGTAFIYSITQLLLGISNVAWVPTPTGILLCCLFDYIVAFSILGLPGLPIFRKNGLPGLMIGGAAACVLRFASHFFCGAVVWYSITKEGGWNDLVMQLGMWSYSFVYNITFMGPEIVITLIALPILYRVLKNRRT